MKKTNIIYSIMTALFVVLISIGAYIKINIPGSPVPVVLQNMFILLAGLILGKKWGFNCVITYLLIGLLGLPVFAGGTSGPAVFAGPTAGYLLSYAPAVFLIGMISESRLVKNKALLYSAAVLAGTAVIYICGVSWLKFKLNADLTKALAVGFYPFIVWDLIKAAASVAVALFIKPVIKNVFED